jgi:3-oxoisoapionate decarboxylase
VPLGQDIVLGVSSYSFHALMKTGDYSLFEAIDWVAGSAGEHLELAVLSDDAAGVIPNIDSDPAYVDQVRAAASDAGVTLSNLAFHAEFWSPDGVDLDQAIERTKRYVDLAERLGIERVRHDVVAHAGLPGDDGPAFEQAFPDIVRASKEVAQYGATKGITTSVENHGFFVQSSDRIRRIIEAVDEPNFRTTLDVGNFVCVDEDPVSAVTANLPIAMIVHFKDFRSRDTDQGDGWFRSRGGAYLQGSIVGEGDLDLVAVARAVRDSGYSGYASIEFEGPEDPLVGIERGLANAAALLAA